MNHNIKYCFFLILVTFLLAFATSYAPEEVTISGIPDGVDLGKIEQLKDGVKGSMSSTVMYSFGEHVMWGGNC